MKTNLGCVVLAALVGCAPLPPPSTGKPAVAAAKAPSTLFRVVGLTLDDGTVTNLRVSIHRHVITTRQGPRQVWTYVTEGLATHLQHELVMTLDDDGKRTDNAFHEAPLRYFQSVYGHPSVAGGIDLFERPLDFGGSQIGGMLWVPKQAIAGLNLPAHAMTVLPVVGDEAAFARRFGTGRLLSRLGNHHRQFPYPFWHDLGRQALFAFAKPEETVLAKMETLTATGLSVLQTPRRVILRLHRDAGSRFVERLSSRAPGAAVALLTDVDLTADSAMVFVPGSPSPVAIGPEGSPAQRRSGAFLAVVPDQGNKLSLIEDGFALFLPATDWKRFTTSMIEGKELVLPASGKRPEVALEIVQGRDLYFPAVEQPDEKRGPLREIRFLTSDEQIGQRTTVAALVAWLKAIEGALAADAPTVEVTVRCTLSPDKPPSYTVVGEPDLTPAQKTAVVQRLRAVTAPAVHSGAVELQLRLMLKP